MGHAALGAPCTTQRQARRGHQGQQGACQEAESEHISLRARMQRLYSPVTHRAFL